MSTHKHFDKICCIILAVILLITVVFINGEAIGIQAASRVMGYENKLFDYTAVHSIDLTVDGWEEFLETCTNEEYIECSAVIDGEIYKNIAIRAKGNTSLSSVKSYGNDRYSFKVEFDHYDSSMTYHGLDKLCLNNIIQDNTYMKDFLVYQMMRKFGAASPLCSFAYITVNGEDWGLYLAVEAVENSFLQRNYGADYGELYKPDSMSFGGGRGNGKDFDMEGFFDENFSDDENADISEIVGSLPEEIQQQIPDDFAHGGSGGGMGGFGGMPENGTGGFDPSQFGGMGGMTPPTMGGDTDSGTGEFDPSQFGGMGGMTPPTMGGNTDSGTGEFDPSQFGGMTSPTMGGNTDSGTGGFDPSQFGGMGGMTPPEMNGNTENGTIPEMPTENGGENTRPNGNRGEIGGGMGNDRNGRGMGSTDVKLQYTDDDPTSYENIFNNAKTDISDSDKARLISALKKLSEGDTSAVEIEDVIRYFVVHIFSCNGDSYTGNMIHNYYLYEEDGVMSMLPWDYNLAFGGFDGNNANSSVNSPIDTPVSGTIGEDRPMVSWIFSDEEYTEQYHELFGQFISELFDTGWVTELIDSTAELIAPYVEKDPTKFCTYEQFTKGVETLKEFCVLRAESVSGQLDGSIPSTTEGQSGSTALVDASSVNISDMGSMGNMGGDKGGFGGNMGGRPDRDNSPWGDKSLSDSFSERQTI